MDAPSLAPRYLDSCTRHRVQPNAEVLSWFSKAQAEMASCRKCHIVISLDQLRDTDIFPLTDAFMEIGSSAIDKVDILHKSPSPLNAEHLFALMHAINLKLHVVDIQDRFLGEDFLSNLSQGGISCRVLNLWSTQVQKLNMVGRFTHLHTLNLDFCASITSFHKDCFSCMPNLMRLSMCETRIANLWTTTAVLSSLPSLVELRFQKCLCCHDTGPCTSLYGKEMNLVSDKVDSAQCNLSSCGTPQIVYDEKAKHKVLDEVGQVDGLLSLKDSSIAQEFHGTNDGISGGTEVKLSTQFTRINFSTNKEERLQNEITDNDKVILTLHKQKLRSRNVSFKKYVSHHPSPICYEKYYREYMIVSLPRLEVLDNLPIQHVDKEIAKTIVSSYYENLPYQWQKKESITAVLHQREMGKASFYHPKSFKVKHSVSSRKGQHFFLRSLTAAKLRSTVWPVVQSVSQISHLIKEGTRLRPRQFEYNPLDPALMAFGTLDGDIVVINHENGKVAACVSSTGNSDSILGLCWLKKYPSKLIAGSDNGSLKLFDINFMPPKVPDFSFSYDAATFDDFEQLTSVHVNSTDDRFLASGYRRDIALYDTASGKRIQLFRDLHREPINVAKFANHSPFLFATSSFDRDVKMWDLRQNPLRPCYTTSSSRENVMVCFSPDDHYLLVSAVDNEVKQLLACDGRLQMKFEITPTGSAHNYTRSYYMNGRDYIISGSCDEHVVRICSAQTGRRLRDFVLEDGNSRNFMYVQSLRGDPFRDFHFSVLAASTRASSKCEIMKVNLLASEDHKDQSYNQSCLPSYSLGG